MKQAEYLKLAEDMVKFSKASGADDAVISIGNNSNFSVECRNGKIERLEDASSTSLSIKVIVQNKVATASTSDLNRSTSEKLIINAVKRARLSGEDKYATLPEKSNQTIDIASLKLYDENIQKMKPEEIIKIAQDLEAKGMQNKSIKTSNGSSCSTNVGTSCLAMSNGFSGYYDYSYFSSGVALQTGSDDKLYEDGWWETVTNLSKFPSIDTIAQKAIERTLRLLGAKKAQTQNVPIVFDPQISAMLLGFFAQCVNGNSIHTKQSYLVDKLGQSVGNSLLTIIDDGTIAGATGSRPYDREGVPTKKLTIVEKGILNSYILDTYSANKLNLKTTGHAGGTTNLYIAAGKSTPEDIIKSVKNGLYLTNTIGQGTVATTGDISKGASGLWIENGKLTYPVDEITISGNLGKIFHDIEMVGNDLDFRRSRTAPTLKVKEMSISGV